MTPTTFYILETFDLATNQPIEGSKPVCTDEADAITLKSKMKRQLNAQGTPWLDVRITTRYSNDPFVHVDPDIARDTSEGGTEVTPNTTNPLALEAEQTPTIVFDQLNRVHELAGRVLNVNEAEAAARVAKCAALVAYLRGMSERSYNLLKLQCEQYNRDRDDDDRARAELNAARASERRACGAI